MKIALALAGGAVVGLLLLQHLGRKRRNFLRRLCRALPKVELHAHLNGCARLSTIAELAPAGMDTSALQIPPEDDRSLDACFAIFAAIHKTVTTLAAVRRVASEVLADFADDNVKYLELRTTPRDLQDADAEGCVRAVMDELARFEAAHPGRMLVRLMLSVDRTGGLDKAMATIELAAKLRAEGGVYIVGVDFSGNPTRGCFAEYVPAFELARKKGLRIAAHSGEVDHAADNAAIINFRPDRLGHALLLSASDFSALAQAPIPIELCPTSNLMTLRLPSVRAHPTLRALLRAGYPVSISTDDSTVFGTTPSRELAIAAEAAGLSDEQVVALAIAPLDHAFVEDDAKARLREMVLQGAAEGCSQVARGGGVSAEVCD